MTKIFDQNHTKVVDKSKKLVETAAKHFTAYTRNPTQHKKIQEEKKRMFAAVLKYGELDHKSYETQFVGPLGQFAQERSLNSSAAKKWREHLLKFCSIEEYDLTTLAQETREKIEDLAISTNFEYKPMAAKRLVMPMKASFWTDIYAKQLGEVFVHAWQLAANELVEVLNDATGQYLDTMETAMRIINHKYKSDHATKQKKMTQMDELKQHYNKAYHSAHDAIQYVPKYTHKIQPNIFSLNNPRHEKTVLAVNENAHNMNKYYHKLVHSINLNGEAAIQHIIAILQ